MNLPRGIRNKNPLNLRLTALKWQGKVPNAQNTDKSFEQFTDVYYGYRAAALDLLNDYKKKGLNTINKLIGQFAPPNENNTESYAKKVANQLQINPDSVITLDFLKSNLASVLYRMHVIENGKTYHSLDEIQNYVAKFNV